MQTLEEKIQYEMNRRTQEIMEYYDELEEFEKGSEEYIWRRNEIRTSLIKYLKNLKSDIQLYYEEISEPSDYMISITYEVKRRNRIRNFHMYYYGSSMYKHRITVYDVIKGYYESYIIGKKLYLHLLSFL